MRVTALIGIILIITGFMLVGLGLPKFLSPEVYFMADHVTLYPGSEREIFVVPGASITIEYELKTSCLGRSRLVVFDQYGNIVWINSLMSDLVEIPNRCTSGLCIYKIRLEVPQDCPTDHKTAWYSVYVTTRDWRGLYAVVIGLPLLIGGIILVARKTRKTSIYPPYPPPPPSPA